MEEVESEGVLSDQNVTESYNVTQEEVKFQEDLATLMTIGNNLHGHIQDEPKKSWHCSSEQLKTFYVVLTKKLLLHVKSYTFIMDDAFHIENIWLEIFDGHNKTSYL